jgi:prepilin-type N-terminal cleavage/methylation domain-containing protein
MRVAPARRRGYTLLEILIASAIGVMLLGALYVALDVQLGLTRSGREAVNTSAVARGLLDRISSDVSLSLGPIPVQTSTSNSSAGGTQSGAGATASATSATGGSAGSTAAATPTTTTSSTPPFNLGVQGDDTHLTLYLSRWPREVVLSPSDPNYNNQNGNLPIESDLRRVTWWLADGGLARQEILIATSDDALNSSEPDLSVGNSSIVAPEVTAITFQYFDGNQWQTSWDGTQAGSDGVTPIGPPIAISVDMTLVLPSSEPDGVKQTKTYHHVISLDTANGATQQSPGSNSSSTGGTSP